ncbi:hypothetical protein H0A43_00470 [Arcobacter lanthieri]|uniref:hypothetical protein n=1 Tax=Aliarcobacter lanthieri TaxID=1355374 RepID=UPI001922D7F4|nr:hypothetical protein [Aliarcobacter lanthieri]MBL3518946.1 hypothetical protein [Aliarcobacter lanthieri]
MKKDKLPTYKMVQEDIKSKYNITIKTCWIAHVKEMYGLIKKILIENILVQNNILKK